MLLNALVYTIVYYIFTGFRYAAFGRSNARTRLATVDPTCLPQGGAVRGEPVTLENRAEFLNQVGA